VRRDESIGLLPNVFTKSHELETADANAELQ
jgi:hypothetical protein